MRDEENPRTVFESAHRFFCVSNFDENLFSRACASIPVQAVRERKKNVYLRRRKEISLRMRHENSFRGQREWDSNDLTYVMTRR
jgi:hypothetical protein